MSEADTDHSEVIVIARLPKNGKEELVASLTEYKSHQLVDLRTYANYLVEDDNGMRPTKKGVCFRIAMLPQVITVLQECEAEARRRGILPDGAA